MLWEMREEIHCWDLHVMIESLVSLFRPEISQDDPIFAIVIPMFVANSLPYIYMYMYMYMYIYIYCHFRIYLSMYLSIYLSTYLSIYPFIYLSI